jgi:hypothetical protein
VLVKTPIILVLICASKPNKTPLSIFIEFPDSIIFSITSPKDAPYINPSPLIALIFTNVKP